MRTIAPAACLACLMTGTLLPGAAAADEYAYPAKGVPASALKSDDRVVVKKADDHWSFTPARGAGPPALLFFPGGGVEPTAYAPLARAIAAGGVPVHLVNLPAGRAAPAEHVKKAIAAGQAVVKSHPGVKHWVAGGHSMGGAIAAELVHARPKSFRGLVLIGTTHPRRVDLSSYPGAVTKVYATEDGVARLAWSKANGKLLPAKTTWVGIDGGNHAQFGHYGTQFGDGKATISRAKQHELTADAVVKAVRRAAPPAK